MTAVVCRYSPRWSACRCGDDWRQRKCGQGRNAEQGSSVTGQKLQAGLAELRLQQALSSRSATYLPNLPVHDAAAG